MAEKRTDGRIDTDGVRHQGRGTSLGDILRARGLVANVPAKGNDGPVVYRPTSDSDAGVSGALGSVLASTLKVVLRRQRKGRGGKTVTRVEGIEAQPPVLEVLSRELRRDLGCGGTVEDGVPVLQGDVGDRAAEWLTARGVRRVVRG
jgi:translation initiation factor 1